MKIFTIIPAYNEEKTIVNIVKKIKKYSPVIVVDDGSKDRTGISAKKVGAILITHQNNQGYGTSLIDGIYEARKRKAKFIITLDADGQHNPDDIPKFIKALEEGYDIVAGSRFLGGRPWGTWKRQLSIKALTLQAYLFSGLKLTDIQSGFRAYNTKIFEKISLKHAGMGFSVELPIKAKKLGYRFIEVPIKIKKPYRIKSFWKALRQGIEVGIAIIKYSLF
ncbi:MAG: glycosyltransferase family 2 protein [Spirochaetota bacterium]|nr:glycosyltransferase family 2 protein [Spirochaetota bacterium]